MDVLPDDLIKDILFRLPIKSVFRSKCIAKRYLGIISSPSFPDEYCHSRPDPLGCLFFQSSFTTFHQFHRFLSKAPFFQLPAAENEAVEEWKEYYDVDVVHSPLPPQGYVGNYITDSEQELLMAWDENYNVGTFVLDASNGLILCSRKYQLTLRYCVCNPVTRQGIVLPKARCAFVDCTALLHFPKRGNSFMVIRLPRCKSHDEDDSDLFRIEIFSSETGRWSELQNPDPPSDSYVKSPPVLLNGVIYWIDKSKRRITTYDIEGQSSSFVPLPVAVEDYRSTATLGQSCGLLRYAQSNYIHMQVWALTDISRQLWSLKYKFSLFAMVRANYDILKRSPPEILPLAFHLLDEQVLIMKSLDTVMFYHMEKGTIDQLGFNLKMKTVDQRGIQLYMQYLHPPWPVTIPMVHVEEIKTADQGCKKRRRSRKRRRLHVRD